jgi:hypothetical protein
MGVGDDALFAVAIYESYVILINEHKATNKMKHPKEMGKTTLRRKFQRRKGAFH